MTFLLLEALGAGLLFVGIIWWTMFSGRKKGELPTDTPAGDAQQAPAKGVNQPPTATNHQKEIDR